MAEIPENWQLETTADGEIVDINSRRPTPIHGINITRGLKIPRNETQVVSCRLGSSLARNMDEIVAGRRIPGVLTRSDFIHTAIYYFTEKLKSDYPDVMSEGMVGITTHEVDMQVLKYRGVRSRRDYKDAVEMFDEYFDDAIMLDQLDRALDISIKREMDEGLGSVVVCNQMRNLQNKIHHQLERLSERDQ